MTTRVPFKALIPLPIALLLVSGANAELGLSGTLSAGYEHDSNVSVDELDRTSSRGDGGLVLGADIAIEKDLTESTDISASYGFSRIDYQTFSALSRDTHMLGLNVSTDWEKFETSLNYFYIRAQLDGRDFLTYQRISPSISGFVSKRWFLRGAYVRGDKEVNNRPGRNAVNDGLELDAYFFWNGLRRYINVGYNFRAEDSQADRFDYRAHQAKLRFVQRIEVFGKLSTLEMGLRYEDRDFSNVTPSFGIDRNDKRLRGKVSFELPITESVLWQVYSGHSDYSSNLPSADYQQTLIGSRLEWVFP